MKKLNSIICIFLSFIGFFYLCSCSQEELTGVEMGVVGKWELTEIQCLYTNFEMNSNGTVYLKESYLYNYPNTEGNPSGLAADKLFDEIVEKYWGNTWFDFKDNKKDGWVDGYLYDVNGKTSIIWRESSSGLTISQGFISNGDTLVWSMYFDSIVGEEIKSKVANSLMYEDEVRKIKIFTRDGYYSTSYIFTKTDNK